MTCGAVPAVPNQRISDREIIYICFYSEFFFIINDNITRQSGYKEKGQNMRFQSTHSSTGQRPEQQPKRKGTMKKRTPFLKTDGSYP